MTGPHPNQTFNKAVAAIVAFVVAIAVFRAGDIWNMKLLLLTPCVGYQLWRYGHWQWSAVDVTVAMLWLYDVVQCFIAADTQSAIVAAGQATTAAAVYWLVRACADRRLLTNLLVLIAVALAVVFTGTFFVFRKAVTDAGFESCYDFRYLLSPLTMSPNIITSLLLALTGISLSTGRHRDMAASVFTSAALLLSFSRGAILSLGLLGTVLVAVLGNRGEKLRTAAVVAGAFVVVWLCCPTEMTTALNMSGTESQRRSTMSRVSGSQAAAIAFAHNPATGYGPRSFMTATDSLNDPKNTGAITNLAPNWIAEIAVEKGAAGLALYAALLLATGVAVWRNRRNRTTLVCGATLLALAFKEMTQSTVYGATSGMILVAILLSLIQPQPAIDRNQRNRLTAIAVMIAMFVGTLTADIAAYRTRQLTELTFKASTECRNGNFSTAMRTLDSLPPSGVVNTAKAIVCLNAFAAENDTLWLTKAKDCLNIAVDDSLTAELRAMTRLMKDKAECRRDTWHYIPYEHALWLYRSGHKKESFAAMKNIIPEEPRLFDATNGKPFADDTAFISRLQTELTTALHADKALTPDSKARQGYLAMRLGDTATAESRLLAATSAMPSYSTPWKLLAEINSARGDTATANLYKRRFRLLDYGILHSSTASETEPVHQTVSPQWNRITVKYRIWHNTVLPILQLEGQ